MTYNPIQQIKELIDFIFPKSQPSRLEKISRARIGARRGAKDYLIRRGYSRGMREAHFYNPNL